MDFFFQFFSASVVLFIGDSTQISANIWRPIILKKFLQGAGEFFADVNLCSVYSKCLKFHEQK